MLSYGLKRLNKAIKFSTLVFTGSVLCGTAMADGAFFGKEAAGKWLIGPKVVNIDPNIDTVSDASGVGIVAGYEFDKDIAGGKSSFELEYISGDEEEININAPATYEVSVLNAFFAYRTAGDLYFKIKGGVSYVDIDVDTGVFLDDSFEDVSLAAGIGLGYRINDRGLVEIEYTQDSGDSDLGILGLNGLFSF